MAFSSAGSAHQGLSVISLHLALSIGLGQNASSLGTGSFEDNDARTPNMGTRRLCHSSSSASAFGGSCSKSDFGIGCPKLIRHLFRPDARQRSRRQPDQLVRHERACLGRSRIADSCKRSHIGRQSSTGPGRLRLDRDGIERHTDVDFRQLLTAGLAYEDRTEHKRPLGKASC